MNRPSRAPAGFALPGRLLSICALCSIMLCSVLLVEGSAAEPQASWTPTLSVVFAPSAVTMQEKSRGPVPLASAVRDAGLRQKLESLGARSIEAAFTRGVTLNRSKVTLPDLSRFCHVTFDNPEAALLAATDLATMPGVLLAQPIPDNVELDAAGEDPYLSASWWFQQDSQWCLVNRGLRSGVENCGHALAGSDLRVHSVWKNYYQTDQRRLGAPPPKIGSAAVVLGFVDQGILDDHPELHVLKEFSHDPRFSFCPEKDWFGSHATKMSGLAGMAAENGIGGAGVCGECSLLDLAAPSCDCSQGENPAREWGKVHPLWYTKLISALQVPLGSTEAGQPRSLLVVNASFGTSNYAPLEEVEALWTAYQAGVLFVASAGDQSFDTPQPVEPANIPFVLGVGGHTWEDRFWDASVSCYTGERGTTIGPGVVDLTAPASGAMISASAVEIHPGSGLYSWTSGQCSAATALVTGAAGLVQSYAHDGSPLGHYLDPDDLAGLLTATTRPYAADPTAGATCPPSVCPRSYYGTGMASVENAFFALTRANEWRRQFVGLSDGCTVAPVGPDFKDEQGTTWREYRITWEFTLTPRTAAPGAPVELPRYVAWPLKSQSTSLCSYGPAPARVLYAQAGIRDCSIEVNQENGRGRLIGANFVSVKQGRETPVVPWAEFEMGMTYWSDPASAPFADRSALRKSSPGPSALRLEIAGPNPFHQSVQVLFSGAPGAEGTVEVVDVGGRVIRTLVAGAFSAGARSIEWDGMDSSSREVSAGLYWVRLRSAGDELARSVVRM